MPRIARGRGFYWPALQPLKHPAARLLARRLDRRALGRLPVTRDDQALATRRGACKPRPAFFRPAVASCALSRNRAQDPAACFYPVPAATVARPMRKNKKARPANSSNAKPGALQQGNLAR